MKFLIHVDNYGGHLPYKTGLGKVLHHVGHEVVFWDTQQPNHQPLFDIFARYQPKVFYTNTYDVSEEMIRVIQKYPETKIILFSSAHGQANKDVAPQFNIVRVTEDERRLVGKLKKLTGKPEFVFIHHHPNQVDYTLGGWTDEFGIRAIGIPNAADLFTFLNGTLDPQLECDIAYCGGYWPYKGQNINKFIFPLCSPTRNPRLSVKIFGNQGSWGDLPQFLGYAQDETLKSLFASTKICPNVHEPHSTEYGKDVVERPFKTIAAGGFTISDHVTSLVEDFFPLGEIPTARTSQEYADLVDYYLDKPEERQLQLKLQRQAVFARHTYFDRASQILEGIGEPVYAKDLLTWKKLFLQRNNLND